MSDDAHQPLAVRRYRLTQVDALACERLPGEWSGRAKPRSRCRRVTARNSLMDMAKPAQ